MSMLQQPAEASAPSAELENSAVPVSPGFLRSQRVVIVACALVCAIAAALIFGLYVYPFVIEPAILAASSADMQKDGKDDYTTEPTNMESSTGAHWAWPVRLASSGSEYNTGGMDKSGQNGADRKNSAAKENPRLAQLGTVDRGKPAERRMSTFKQAVPVTPGRRRSAARRYRPSMSRASRRRSTASKWGRGVYITVIVVGVLLAIGGGFGIGVALYPNILSSPSIQDALGSNPIDVQSDNSDDEEIIISDSPTSSTNQPRAIGIDDVNCGRSALVATAAAQRFRSLVEENELLDRRKRIVNGVLGSLIYFPWQVSLWLGEGHACGGSIISSNWILTAAHCLQPNPDPKNWTVHAGVNLQQEMYSGISQEMEPSDLVIHPSYSTETFENDIALIRLMDHLTMGRMVSPVCLPTSDDEVVAGEKCFISGWGAPEEGGDVEPALLNATVEIIDDFVCNGDEWLDGLVATDVMLCAGKESGEVDACQGDSGGPLSCQRDDGRFIVSGVVSWGIGCGTYRMPGVYSRMSRYRSWVIESIETVELKYR